MTTITFFRDSEERICGFRFEGHTDYADEGSDIICAAISTLVESTANGIERYGGDPIRVTDYPEIPMIALQIDGKHSRESEVLLKTLLDSSKELVQSYPDFVQIGYEEV